MPRDAQGNYTLPAGNPVQAGTLIESTWANGTMSDIGAEITNSLDRSGRGGMLAPFKLFDGTVGAPGMSFANEPSTGFYRPANGVMGVSVKGVQRFQYSEQAVSVFGVPFVLFDTAGASMGSINPLLGGNLQARVINGFDIANGDGTAIYASINASQARMFKTVEIRAGQALKLFDADDADGAQTASFFTATDNTYTDVKGGWFVRKADGTNLLTLDQSGNLVATGNVTAYSDERLKTNITEAGPIVIPKELRAVRYTRTDTHQNEIGVIAQALQKCLPECVHENRDGMLSVDYGRAALVLLLAGWADEQ